MRSAHLPAAWAAFAQGMREVGPGFATALTVAAAASFVAGAYGGPVMLLALLIGMALHFLAANPAAQAGLNFASKPVLQVGVALLGLRISYDEIAGLGPGIVLLVIAGVALACAAGLLLARLFRQSAAFGLLAGGATGICGASAALAIASVLPRTPETERQTAFVIVVVTTLSTVAMIFYPVIAHLAGFDDRATGILLGATIHDVAQVIGAGYAVSPEAGDTATIVKLLRVALLLPTVFVIALAFGGGLRDAARARHLPPVPLFAVAFAVLVAVNSLHLLPAAVTSVLIDLSQWCLVTAVASIGIRTAIPELRRMGGAAMAVPVGATVALLVLVAAILLILG